jgi:hypothetical protein
MEVHETDVDVGMAIVGVHGVFVAAEDGEVLGFDRMFVLLGEVGITNDHFAVRRAPHWEE